MTDLEHSERLDLASRVFYYFRQQAGDLEPPAYENLTEQDLMGAMIAGMRHYSDWRGINFDSAVAAGNKSYFEHRADEEYPYSLVEEVEHIERCRSGSSLDDGVPAACRGMVTSIFPERDGTRTYYVRFLGETELWPLKNADLRPAPALPGIVISQGILKSLAEAERLLVESGARIRSYQLRDMPPPESDVTDRDRISSALAEACLLTVDDILRLVEPQVTAWTAEITKPWRPVAVNHPNELAILGFPQPVQAAIEPHHQGTSPKSRTEPAERTRAPRHG